MSRPQLVHEIIEEASVKNSILKKGALLAKLYTYWHAIIGEDFSKQCTPEKLENKTLWLATRNPVWSQQIHFFQKTIIKKINYFFQQELVQYIRCEQGSFKNQECNKNNEQKQASLQEIESKEMALEGTVADSALKNKLARIWAQAKNFFAFNESLNKKCSCCDRLFAGTHPSICIHCEEKAIQEKRIKVAQLLREVPWASFASLQKELKKIGEEVFFDIKAEIKSKKHEEMWRAIWQFLEKPDIRKKEPLLKKILEYVSLRSGLTPDKINDKIIEQILGVRRTRLLKAKGVRI